MLDRAGRLLSSPRFPLLAALVALVLTLPALTAGPMMDDHANHHFFHPPAGEEATRPDWDLFRFQDADAAALRDRMDRGMWPWWTSPTFRLAFLRPLAALWHALDYRSAPGAYVWMHAESVLLYGLVALVAGLVYRRFFGAVAAAGLATLLFAVDDAHAMVVAWIANRHALLSALFGFLALALHDRARRDDWKPGVWLAPAGFAVSLLAGEGGTSTLAYLVAHAAFVDRAPLRARLVGLAPCGVVALAWAVTYRALGYGVAGAGFYVDPTGEPLAFLHALATRGPALLAAQLAVPPAEVWGGTLPSAQAWMPLVTLPIVAVVGLALVLGLRHDRMAAFWAVGMLLSLVPACATWPADRLLLFPGLGAFGLIASFLTASRAHLGRAGRGIVRGAVAVFVLLHLVIAVPFLPLRIVATAKVMRGEIERAAASLPEDVFRPDRTVVVVNAPDTLVGHYAMAARGAQKEQLRMPGASRLLAVAVAGRLEVARPDERTLTLTLSEGLLHDWTSLLFRSPKRPFHVGERVQVPGMVAEVTSLMEDQVRPRRVDFTFDRSLEDPSLVWLIWEGTQFVGFVPPAVGASVTLPAIDYAQAIGM
ncbi:hypothetical protein [Chondromyces crocatus]|uniref:Glycosyltransferase RgtA/B/C/D-like domain-containing protein n=1 Tax=Chondromyces crocatus TaxID=52 RepID=A0A0K1ETA6_CHOCO|nr:hypothetical protein [Chondromyces crocatus]AKT44150.1 uncharacterized protein CMC5_083900 [Chondromyces crocatus]